MKTSVSSITVPVAFGITVKELLLAGYLYTEFDSFTIAPELGGYAIPLRKNGEYFALVLSIEDYFGSSSVNFYLYKITNKSMLYTRLVNVNKQSCKLEARLESWIGEKIPGMQQYEYKKIK